MANFVKYVVFFIGEKQYNEKEDDDDSKFSMLSTLYFEKGVLTLTISKAEGVKPKQIKVRAKTRGAAQGKK